MPVNKMLKSILYGFGLMLMAAGMMYGITLASGPGKSQEDSTYVSKLNIITNDMEKISVDEANTVQQWRAETVDAGTAVADFADYKARRQNFNAVFFTRAAPAKFTEIHFALKDSNDISIEADDLYREGIFQRRDDFITGADAKTATAKQKFDAAIIQLNALGVSV